MKKIQTLLFIFLVPFLAINCKDNAAPEIVTVEVETKAESNKVLDPNATYAKAEFTVNGMMCEIGCAKTIEKKLAEMDGVKFASVNFNEKLAMIEYDEAKVTPEIIEETVTKIADIYKVSDMKTVDAFSE
ncbi:MAG TPA: heavy metal-associated domain-containing protein [Flavobacteriaceae bacterium]|nr:heavy metal-associated domain-containing protein [Flavobacteriaceae bacterium]